MPNPCLEDALGGRIIYLCKNYYTRIFNNSCAKFAQKISEDFPVLRTAVYRILL